MQERYGLGKLVESGTRCAEGVRKACRERWQIASGSRRLNKGSYFLLGLLASSLTLAVACSPNIQASDPDRRILPNGGGLVLPPTPGTKLTVKPIATPTPEPTPIPDPWHSETAQPGKAFLDVLDEGCVNGKPAITVLSRFIAEYNDPKVGILGITRESGVKKPKGVAPFILGLVGISDSEGEGRDKRFYNGEAKPEKQFTSYPVSRFELGDGQWYRLIIYPGRVVIGESGKSSKVELLRQPPLAEKTFHAASCSR